MEWIRKSFARRVVFAYSVIFALIFLLAGLFLENRLENQSLRNLKENLITETRLLSRLFSGSPFQNADLPALQNTCLGLKKDSQTRVTLVDASGKVLADSSETLEEVSKMENHKNRPEIRTALEGGTGYEVRYSDTLRRKMLYAAVPVYQKREIAGAVRTSVSLDHVARILSAIRHPLLACLGGRDCSDFGCRFVVGFLHVASHQPSRQRRRAVCPRPSGEKNLHTGARRTSSAGRGHECYGA